MSDKQYMSVHEFAHDLDVSEEVIRINIRSGRIPAIKVGHSWRIPYGSAIEAMPRAKGTTID